MTTRRENRNKRIKEEIRNLRNTGLKIKDAITIVADIYSLSPVTILDIWYDKKVRVCQGISIYKEK